MVCTDVTSSKLSGATLRRFFGPDAHAAAAADAADANDDDATDDDDGGDGDALASPPGIASHNVHLDASLSLTSVHLGHAHCPAVS